MSVEVTIAIAVCTVLAGLAFVLRQAQGTFLAPAPAMAALWVPAGLLPLAFSHDYPAHPLAYGFVLLCAIGCGVGALLGAHIPGRKRGGAVRPALVESRTWTLYAVMVVLGLLAPISVYLDTRTVVGSVGLEELAVQATYARYQGDLVLSVPTKIALSASYLAALLSGFGAGMHRRRRLPLWRVAGWLGPLVGLCVIQTAKAPIYYATLFWAAAWAAGRVYSGRTLRMSSRGTVVRAAGGLVALVGFLIVSQALRMGRLRLGDLAYVLEHLKDYVAGHMPVFGHWLTHQYAPEHRLGLGAHTFAGAAEAIGLHQRDAGIYAASAPFSDANIYTFARPLLEDFGVVGGFVFLVLLAALAGRGFRRLARGELAGAGPLVFFLAYVLSSPITPAPVYSGLLVALLAFWGWMRWLDSGRRGERAAVLALGATLDVTAYGADPGGEEDSTAAIQAALDAARAGDVVTFPEGRYRTGNIEIRDKTAVAVRGSNATLQLQGASAGRVGIELKGTLRNVQIAGLAIVGDGIAEHRHAGIWSYSGQRIAGLDIRDNEVTSVTAGIVLNASRGGRIDGAVVADNRINDIVGTDPGVGYGIYFADGSGRRSRAVISNNWVNFAERHSIYIARGRGLLVENNLIVNHRRGVQARHFRPAIVAANCQDVVVRRNRLIATSDGALFIASGHSSPTSRIVVERNFVSSFRGGHPVVTIGNTPEAPLGPPTAVAVFGNILAD